MEQKPIDYLANQLVLFYLIHISSKKRGILSSYDN